MADLLNITVRYTVKLTDADLRYAFDEDLPTLQRIAKQIIKLAEPLISKRDLLAHLRHIKALDKRIPEAELAELQDTIDPNDYTDVITRVNQALESPESELSYREHMLLNLVAALFYYTQDDSPYLGVHEVADKWLEFYTKEK